ncbi:Centriolin Centrosomal protein 1 [Triplophysa tibetana]|uniref:Centriolin Centrosomal protein 1 n=1 Tax=Triplophysa tibetana TaxID=1572043 RepID=A0A5A9P1F0_9TELE|nr:Centriolin Centrosomal protein 1 [Triplophysa tibetana]
MKKGGQTRKGSPAGGFKLSKSVQGNVESPNVISWPEAEDGDLKDKTKHKGTRYITEDLIKKLTKCDNLALVRTLNLSTSLNNDKQFRYIENLGKCEHLQVLILSNNKIEKVEKLENLSKLRELHLSNNAIQKIEGLEHMSNLQILNFAFNNIEHLPIWLAKKLRSLQTINLQRNKIFSLNEMAKLKPLKNLTSLTLAENPVAGLPHYHLFIIFHLRSLEMLDGQPISPQKENKHISAFTWEVERLEQELELRCEEISRLQGEQTAAQAELERQERANQSLRQENKEQQRSHEELRRELDTKSELLKQKSVELTRACQKHYELEQDLAFHKIDAKFEPLPFSPDPEVEMENLSSESPYIGKARQKRMVTFASDNKRTLDLKQDLTETDNSASDNMFRQAQLRAEDVLQQLHKEIEEKEQQILRASEELQQLEETLSQRRICEAEKDQVRQELQRRIQRLGVLREEMKTLEKRLDRQSTEKIQAQGEMEQMQSILDSLDPSDPRYTHVKARLSRTTQLLAIMSRKHQELESRLDDMITRIHKETQEIKELEQQLTDGQIAANEALKRDLEGIIAGLQEYLQGVKDQARRAQSECGRLLRDNVGLQRLLHEKDMQCTHLEIEARSAESNQEELLRQQQELEDLRKENEELRQVQGQVSEYETELEKELQERDAQATQLKEELDRLSRLSQMEHSALQAELQKERQAKENALTQMQMATDKELENAELLQQVDNLQEEKDFLKDKVDTLQDKLEQVPCVLLCPVDVCKHLEELKRSIAVGQAELSFEDLGEAVNKSLMDLLQEVHRVVSAAQRDRDEAQQSQDTLAGEMKALRERLRRYQEKYQMEQNQQAAERRGEEAKLQRLKEDLEATHEQQYLMLKRLEDTEIERDCLLAELEEQQKEMKVEESQTKGQLESLSLELQNLKRSLSTADRMAAEQLNDAKNKLHSLHSTIEQIHLKRTANAEELKNTKLQAAQAVQDLTDAEAEIQVLQNLLRERLHETEGNHHSVSDFQQQELDRLNQTLKKQQAHTKRLRDQLAQANEANNENLQELLEEIGALRETLLQQNNFLSSLGDPSPNAGYWFIVWDLRAHRTQGWALRTLNLHTKVDGPEHTGNEDHLLMEDTGSILHIHMLIPEEAGFYLHILSLKKIMSHKPSSIFSCNDSTDAQVFRDSGRESDVEGLSPLAGTTGFTPIPPAGSVMYDHPLPGLPIGSSTAVLYGPPPDGARLVYGPLPGGLTVPMVPSGTLHCNVAGHQDLERDLKNAERRLKDERADRVHGEKEHSALQEKTSDLQREIKRLRRAVHTLQHHTSRLESSVSHTEDEQCVSGEVACVEKTLLKRRAELREADRLLLEAETELKDTKDKTKESMQSYNEARRRVEETERELVEMEKRARDSATQLVHSKQQLRNLQEIIARHDANFQDVNRKLGRATDRLETVKNELKETQNLEAKLLQSCREAENNLTQRQTQLDEIGEQVELQQKELSLLDRKLEQWKQEEEVLRISVDKHRQGLLEVLRQGEEDVHSLQQRIQELRVDVQTLAVQKGELDSQLSERKSRLAQYKTDQQEEEETLHDLRSATNKHKAELKHVLERVHMESSELEGVKIQHNQKLDQLVKSQETLLQVRLELQRVHEELQEQNGEAERQRTLLEKEREELHALQQTNLDLQRQTDTAVQERSSLQEQCKNLEARRMHAQRCLEAAEKEARTAETVLLRRQRDLDRHQQDQKHANELQQEIHRDAAAKLEEEVNRLKKQLVDSQTQLDEIIEEVKTAKKQQDDLVKKQIDQKSELEEKIKRRHQKLDKLGQQLQELKTRLIRVLQQESSDLEQLHRLKQQTLQSQLQAVEGALALRLEQVQQVTAASSEIQDRPQLQRELLIVEKCAQENHKQAMTLQEQLSTFSQEPPGLKDTLQEDSIGLDDFRDTVPSVRELESPPSISSDTDSLKENHLCVTLAGMKPGYSTKDEQWRGDALRERLRQQEDHLKVQLRRRMFSQQEALSQRRLQAEGSILGLRRHVDKLDQLLCNSTKDST